MQPLSAKGRQRALYALFAASGFAALVYQLMWMRGFGLVFGSTTRAASAVLASFFLGLAIGSWLGGRLARNPRKALVRYGVVELAIAAGGLLVIPWLELYREHYPELYRAWLGEPGRLTAFQLGLAGIAMGPPCIAMGATLPLLARAAVDQLGHVGRRVGALYALNTAGATVGVLLSGFLLPVWLGTRGSIGLAAAVSASVGVAALLLARSRPGEEAARAAPAAAPSPMSAPGHRSRSEAGLLIAAAAISGFGTLALEIVYLRLLVNAIDSSVYSFALVLAVFLVCLALGSAAVALWVDRLRHPWVLVAGCALGTAALVLLSPWSFGWATRNLMALSPSQGASFLLQVAALALLLMGSAALLAGVILPTVWKIATREVAEVGARIGQLTFVNTLAGVAGSLAGGFVLVPRLGVGGAAAFVAALYAALGLAALFRGLGARRAAPLGLALVLGLAALASLRPWQASFLRLPARERLVLLHEGEAGSVSVTRGPGGHYLRLNSRYGLGASDPVGTRAHRAQGQLALALHPQPRRVAFIGVATGISVSAVLDFPGVERVVAMELIPGVVDATRFFANANQRVLEDPRVETVIADGRNHLFGTDQRFDVVVGDLFIPWHAGTAYLYTVEHFRIVAQRLAPGGVFVQWLQADQLSVEELRSVVGSFSDAFPECALWLHRVEKRRPLLGLVGWRDEPGDPEQARARLRKLRVAALEPLVTAGPLRAWAASAQRNTDDRPFIEFSAAGSHLGRDAGELRRTLAVLARLAGDG